MDAVIVDSGSKNYRIYAKPADRLKELLFRGSKYHEDFWAVKRVSFRVPQGSTFGVVGENGSGKSTLLQMIAGTLQPTEGTITLHGRVAALLELGAGFNQEFTGHENVFLNAAIMGLSHEETVRKLPEIERFAEIGSFIDQPVKTYSSGMYVRLAFAVAIHVDPDILLVDESLSVGDVYFQQRCMRKIRQMKQDGKTILFVSHDMTAVKNLCDAAIWLEHGELKGIGEPEEVVGKYLARMTMRRDPYASEVTRGNAAAVAGADSFVVRTLPNAGHRWGNGHAEVIGIQILDASGNRCESVEHGAPIVARVSVAFHDDVTRPIVGILMRNRLGEDICGINTSAEGFEIPPARAGQCLTMDFNLKLPLLVPGDYHFTPAIAQGTHEDFVICDQVENAIHLVVRKKTIVYGYMKFESRLELKYLG
jgi:ABC-type polysaccharide/polyol phosphate transport system ATPase subunit